jgi:peptide/nickel transport system substrate-binding protein
MRRFIGAGVAVAAATLAGALAAPAAQAQDDVTIIIGLTQPWETLNPVAGFAVPEYEFWNIQYAPLVNRAAADFALEPGLAESWVENEPGVSYTYTLRDGLLWSDGTPLTAEDIAWNVNTSRDQGWTNYVSTVTNLTAEVVDDRTVTITSSVPDPKLPMLELYIGPKHVWEPIAEAEEMETYENLDGVGSGPYVLEDYQSEESLTLVANENYYGGRPAMDRVIFRYFSNPDAMVAAVERGEIDAAHGVPGASMAQLDENPDIEVVSGLQGGFDEIALNGGQAPNPPHPALLDLAFRQAIAHGIDKEGATEDLWFGYAEPATTVSMGADFKWIPDIPEDELFGYDPALANQLLDEAGYLDTDGNGIREMPGGGDDIVLRHAINTDTDLGQAVGELFSGWMNAIGVDVQLDAYDQDQLFTVIVDGTYDTFYWGWVPFVDPNPMLSYWTAAELGNFNDANWSDPRYDELYLEQQVELDPDRRLEIVHEMVRIIHDNAGYIALWYGPDLQAYRTDRFEGWQQQPAEVGPVIFTQSSPTYATLRPIGAVAPTTDAPAVTTVPAEGSATADASDDTATEEVIAPAPTTAATAEATADDSAQDDSAQDDDGDGGGNGAVIAIVVAALAVLGIGGFALAKRRKSADDRE